jgi:hypothetical protein
MDYGRDFKLVDDDIVFTPDGDVELVEGPACVAQDIDQALKISLGHLHWDKEAGSSLLLMLNDSTADPAAVAAELERVAVADPRTDPATVKAVRLGEKQYRLHFVPLGAMKPETLDYDLYKGGKP